MARRVAILQSNYMPWKGYFDLIDIVDEFIIYDAMQYTRRDWRNRNKVKTAAGLQWLTIPVKVKGKYNQLIDETQLVRDSWRSEHLATIRHAYGRAAAFRDVYPWLEQLVWTAPSTTISELNVHFLGAICQFLGIDTQLVSCSRYTLLDGKTERLVDLCRQAGATEYVSGPAARDYIDPELFRAAGIQLLWKSYAGYPEYRQMHGPFEHHVSIIDLLMNEGTDARKFLHSTPQFEADLM